jgi:probable F420-dependent oxidoreductase
MKVGINIYPVAVTELAAAARLADEAGYHSLWYGEHVAVPWVYEKGKYPGDKPPFDPKAPFMEIFAVLAHLAAVTTRVRLCSGIAILTVRELLLTARGIAAVDTLSNGRLELGVGTGWMEEEFNILVPHRRWEDRGHLFDEMLDALHVLWREERPEFHGKHIDFPAIGFEPKPVNGRVPILLGGWAERALRRAARYDGYYDSLIDPDEAGARVAILRRYREDVGLADQPYEISIQKWAPVSQAELDDYAAAGVDQVVLTPWEPWTDQTRVLGGIEAYASRIGLA